MEDTKLQKELIMAGADYIKKLASVVVPSNIECARCVVHAIEDLGYTFVKQPLNTTKNDSK